MKKRNRSKSSGNQRFLVRPENPIKPEILSKTKNLIKTKKRLKKKTKRNLKK